MYHQEKKTNVGFLGMTGAHMSIVKALLRVGVDPTAKDTSGHTAALICSVQPHSN